MKNLLGKEVNGLLLLLCAVLLVILWSIPTPQGMTHQVWHLLAIFVTTILGILIKVMPMGMMSLLGLTISFFTGTLTVKDGMAGFGDPIIWLILLAYFIAMGFAVTGLGHRMAYFFVGLLGKGPLGLAYGITFSEVLLAPAIPSNTARGGGVLLPVVESICDYFGSHPDKGTEKKLGSFLASILLHSNIATSAMFLTGMVGNPVIVRFAHDLGYDLTWGGWLAASIVPAAISIILTPLILFKIYPPEIKDTSKAQLMAKEKLKKMGKMSREEKIMTFVFILLIVLWVLSKQLGVHPMATALLGLVILMLTGVLKWKNIVQHKGAWDTLIWFSILLMMAQGLSKFGFTTWITSTVNESLAGTSWQLAFPLLIVAYFFAHYFFASTTAHLMAMGMAFLSIGIGVGVPPLMMIYSMAFMGNVVGGLCHYSSGPAAVIYGVGYIPVKEWIKLGLFMGIVNTVIWVGVGSLWWKVIGLW